MYTNSAIEFEYAFEQNIGEFQLAGFSAEHRKFLSAVESADFKNAFAIGEALLLNSSPDSKSLTLVWLIICSEKQYDLSKKDRYLSWLILHYNETRDLYCLFHIFYFKAITMIYDSQYWEALKLFESARKIATDIIYLRGEIRCVFHKCLIQHLTGNNDPKDKEELKEMLNTPALPKLAASIRKALDFNRAKEPQIDDIQKTYADMCKAIVQKDFQLARKLCLLAEATRRQRGISKRKYSFYFELAKIYFLQGKFKKANQLLTSLNDLTLKSQLQDFLDLHAITNSSGVFLADSLLFKSVYPKQAAPSVTIDTKKIRNLDLAKFIKILSESKEPIDKQQIFQMIYNQYYDPVIHDPKIYRLVLWIRKRIAVDCLVNHYGKYSLNREKYKVVS